MAKKNAPVATVQIDLYDTEMNRWLRDPKSLELTGEVLDWHRFAAEDPASASHMLPAARREVESSVPAPLLKMVDDIGRAVASHAVSRDRASGRLAGACLPLSALMAASGIAMAAAMGLVWQGAAVFLLSGCPMVLWGCVSELMDRRTASEAKRLHFLVAMALAVENGDEARRASLVKQMRAMNDAVEALR